jgi:hypothetical protein
MSVLSPAWIERRLLQDIENITERIQYDRVTRRLTNLYREIMKFRITEDTFFQGQNRKVGDILDFPVGPYRNEVQGPNGLQRIPQFVEVAESVQHVTPLPPLTMPVTTEPSQETFMSITGIQSGAFEAKLAQMRQKLADRLNKGLTKIDTAAEAGAIKMEAAVDGVIAKVDAEIEDKLQEFATMTNGGPA